MRRDRRARRRALRRRAYELTPAGLPRLRRRPSLLGCLVIPWLIFRGLVTRMVEGYRWFLGLEPEVPPVEEPEAEAPPAELEEPETVAPAVAAGWALPINGEGIKRPLCWIGGRLAWAWDRKILQVGLLVLAGFGLLDWFYLGIIPSILDFLPGFVWQVVSGVGELLVLAADALGGVFHGVARGILANPFFAGAYVLAIMTGVRWRDDRAWKYGVRAITVVLFLLVNVSMARALVGSLEPRLAVRSLSEPSWTWWALMGLVFLLLLLTLNKIRGIVGGGYVVFLILAALAGGGSWVLIGLVREWLGYLLPITTTTATAAFYATVAKWASISSVVTSAVLTLVLWDWGYPLDEAQASLNARNEVVVFPVSRLWMLFHLKEFWWVLSPELLFGLQPIMTLHIGVDEPADTQPDFSPNKFYVHREGLLWLGGGPGDVVGNVELQEMSQAGDIPGFLGWLMGVSLWKIQDTTLAGAGATAQAPVVYRGARMWFTVEKQPRLFKGRSAVREWWRRIRKAAGDRDLYEARMLGTRASVQATGRLTPAQLKEIEEGTLPPHILD